jgi:hypothetical protein
MRQPCFARLKWKRKTKMQTKKSFHLAIQAGQKKMANLCGVPRRAVVSNGIGLDYHANTSPPEEALSGVPAYQNHY